MKSLRRSSLSVLALLLLAVLAAPRVAMSAATETDHSQTFAQGTNGYEANVPATAINLLADPTVTFAASQAPNADGTSSHTYATMIDGHYGTVPASGGGGQNVTSISDNTTLTYTFATNIGYTLTRMDIFTGWGDAGRIQSRFTVRYSTVSAPTTFIDIATVNYNPTGANSTWVELTNLGVSSVQAVQFFFPAQQNAYVGYAELAVQGTLSGSALTWTGGGGSGGNGIWDTTPATNNWSLNSTPTAYTDGSIIQFDQTGTNRNITIQAAGVLPGSITFKNDAATPYTFTGGNIIANGPGQTMTLAGTGSVTLNTFSLGGALFANSGTLILNTGNSIQGGTTLAGGTINLGSANALGNSAVTVNSGSLNLQAATHSIPLLAGTGGSIVLGNSTGPVNTTLTLGSTNVVTNYNGVITQAAGATGSLTKAGTALLSLGGASTYTGATTINGGPLRLTANGSLAAGSAVAVNANAILTGTGKANGAVTVAASGHIAPGINTTGNFGNVGTLTLGSANLSQNSILDLDFGTSNSSDLVAVTGALTLPTTGSVTINFRAGTNIPNGTFKILTFGSLVNTFSASSLALSVTPVNGATTAFVKNGNEIDLTVTGGSAAGGLFTSAFLGSGNFDDTIGLSLAKTYINAVNVNGGALTISGVPFTGSGGGAPSGTGTGGTAWSITAATAVTAGQANNVTGSLGSMVNDFCYNGSPATFNLTGLTVGQAYIITFYNRSWDVAGLRPQLFTASDGGRIIFDEDLNAPAQGSGNLLRYSFIANGTAETLTIAPQVAGYTFHFYGFSSEQVFNKTYVSGNTLSTAVFNPAGAPGGVGSNVAFPAQAAPTTLNLDSAVTLGHVLLDGANAWTISGSALTLQTDVAAVSILQTPSGSHTISAPITLANDAVKLGGGTLTLSGAVSGTGGLIVNTGLLVLNGSNSYSGTTQVNGGTLRITSANALGTAAARTLVVNVADGGTLDLNGTSTSAPIPASLSGNGLGNGALINSSPNAATYSGDIFSTAATATAFSVGGAGDITLSGTITGNGPVVLTKLGNNTLTLSGDTDNTNLVVIVVSGTVILNKNSSAIVHAISGNGTLVNTNAVLKISGTGGDQIADTSSVTLSSNGTLDLNGRSETIDALIGFGVVKNTAGPASVLTVGSNGGNSVYGGLLNDGAGALALTKAGSGTFTLGSTGNTYSGATTIASGTLKLGGVAPTGALAHYTLDGSGAVPTTAGAIVDSVSAAHNGTMNTTGATYVPGQSGQGINFTGTQFVAAPDATDLHLTGNFTVSAWLNVANAPPNGTIWGIMGTRTAGALDNTFDFKYQTLNNATSIHGDIGNGTAWLTTVADVPYILTPGVWHMITYSVTATGYAIFVDGAQVATGAYSGTPVFMKNGQSLFIGSDYNTGAAQGELMVGSIDDMYVFPTALSASEVAALYSGAGKLPTNTAVLIGTGAALDVNGNSQSIASLADLAAGQSGLVINGSLNIPATLTLNTPAGSKSYSGLIADQGVTNALSLVKAGPGTQIFTGPNIYAGTTSVTGGVLIVDGSLATGGGAVSVTTGATLRGTGTGATGLVDRTVSLGAGGFLMVGDIVGVTSPKGLFTVNTLAAPAGTVLLRLSNPNTPESDLLNVTAGTPLDLSAATLFVESSPGNYPTQTRTIMQTTAGDFITAKFGNVSRSATGVTVQYVNLANQVIATPSAGTPANRVQLVLNGAVTAATLRDFHAQAEGAGVLLGWYSVSEFQNAGFNVYRREAARSESAWVRINPTLIAGRITDPDSKAYALYDWPSAGAYDYKLESVSIGGLKETYANLAGPIAVDTGDALSAEGAAAASSSVALAAEFNRGQNLSTLFESVTPPNAVDVRTSELIQGSQRAFNDNQRPAAQVKVRAVDLNAEAPVTSSGPLGNAAKNVNAVAAAPTIGARWFSGAATRAASFTGAKVTYSTPGVLLIPQSMLPAGFNANRVSITREGRSMTALAKTANGIVVFAPGYQDDYTDKDALFLRRGNAPTAAGQAVLAQGLFAPDKSVNVESPATVSSEYHDVYFDFDLRPYNFPPWFSSQYLTNGSVQSFTLSTPGASSGAATLTVNLWSLTQSTSTPDHALQLVVNDQPVGQTVWSGGGKMMQVTFQVASGVLNNGANKIELVTPEFPGVDSQLALLHSMSIAYTRQLDGSKPLTVVNAGASSMLYEVANLPGSEAWVVDTRYPDRAALVAYESQPQAGGTYTLRFNAAAGGSGRYLVVPAGMENLPIAVAKRIVKPAKSSPYLAVGPAQFGSGVQSLLLQRSKEGLRGVFADQEELFDYYNNGRYGPAGIQNAVRSMRPLYLLLLGRTTYDYRNFSGLNIDPLCPAFLVSTSFWSQTTSDSTFGDLGRGYPEVAVGRLPVNDAGQLHVAVARVLGYQPPPSGVRVHAVADRNDPEAGDFAAQADALAQAHPELTWQRNYLGVTSATEPEVRAAMKDAANGGANWLFYVGHGNAVHLGKVDPRILDTNNVQEWTGNVIFLQATCTANWMVKNEAGYKSIAMQALTQPQGGISAGIGSSTYMNPQAGMEFMNQLVANAQSGGMRWGGALLKTQQWAAGKSSESGLFADLSKSEQIFGDPAMPVFSKQTPAPPKGSVVPGSF